MLAFALGLGLARAGALAIAPQGDPLPGERSAVELTLWDEPAPVRVVAREGRVYGWEGAEGYYHLDYHAPKEAIAADTLVVELSDGRSLRVSLPMGRASQSRLSVPGSINATTGPGVQVQVRVDGPNLPPPDELTVAVAEGRVVSITPKEGGLELVYEPSDLREPRAVLLGIRDARFPLEPPVWTTVRLSSRAPIDVRTEPGTRLTVSVGGRSYGPSVARADGRASVTIEVRPGEGAAEAILEDSVGNKQSSTIALLRSPRPSMVLLAEGPLVPGVRDPTLFVRALDESGKPWTGPPPTCGIAGGGLGDLQLLEAGSWQVEISGAPPSVGDLLVECTLGDGSLRATTRVPVVQDRAARVVLQVWPEVLTGDLPVAQVRASLENSRGDRLPPEGLTLNVEHGVLVAFRSEEDAVYAEYHGDPMVGDDKIRAVWSSNAGVGEPWSLDARSTVDGVQARVLDRSGRPLVGIPVAITVNGAREAPITDWNGVARLSVELSAPAVAEVSVGTLFGRRIVRPGQQLEVPFTTLVAERDIVIRAGRIQRVAVRVDPREVYTGGVAELRVRLEDAAGVPVTDEPVSIEAELGEVGPTQIAVDGTLVARYTPPPGLLSEDVEIFIRSDTGAFPETTTILNLRPRPLSWSPGVGVGVLTALGRAASPYGELRVDVAVPQVAQGLLYARFSAGYLRHSDEVVDSARGETLSLRMDMVPVGVGVLARRELGLWSVWGGVGGVLAPYRLVASFEDTAVLQGPGLHRPGAEVYGGGGRRVLGGEVFGELVGLSVVARAEDVGYEGQVGGLAMLVGYRVVY